MNKNAQYWPSAVAGTSFRRNNADTPLAQPIYNNALSGGIGGAYQMFGGIPDLGWSDDTGNDFLQQNTMDMFGASRNSSPTDNYLKWNLNNLSNPAAGNAPSSPVDNYLTQNLQTLSLQGGGGNSPAKQINTLDPNRSDAQMNTALAGMPQAATTNPWATGVDATNALGEGVWGAGKGAPSGLNTVANGMGVAGYTNTDLQMMQALDPVQFEALTNPPAADKGMFSDMTGKDWLNTGFGALQTGLGAYGMFSQLGQADRSLDIAQGNLDLKQDSFDETLRHRQALVNQNKSA